MRGDPRPSARYAAAKARGEAVTGARDRIGRRAYVRAGFYPSVSFDAAMDKQSKRDGWRVLSMAGGHDLMVDCPEELANLLIELA